MKQLGTLNPTRLIYSLWHKIARVVVHIEYKRKLKSFIYSSLMCHYFSSTFCSPCTCSMRLSFAVKTIPHIIKRFHWFYQERRDFMWLAGISCDFTWFHLISLDFTWFHLISLDLPDFTWFHLISWTSVRDFKKWFTPRSHVQWSWR